MTGSTDLALIVRTNEDIKAVVSLARSINLLALNAILLSRRAGTVALGFGVISDELRMFSKKLTQTMHTLMKMSYTSVQTVSLYQRNLRIQKLLTFASAQTGDTDFHFKNSSGITREDSLREELLTTYGDLRNLLLEAEEASRFGSVISRSLKIEATYGGDFSNMLSQIALDFGNFIDAIPDILNRLQRNLQGKK